MPYQFGYDVILLYNAILIKWIHFLKYDGINIEYVPANKLTYLFFNGTETVSVSTLFWQTM